MAEYETNDTPQERLKEAGLSLNGLGATDRISPPLMGKWGVENWMTYAAIAQFSSRTYRWLFDACLQDNQQNSNAMRLDPVIWSALRKRQRPVCQLEWQIEPVDENNEREVQAADRQTRIIQKIPDFQQMRRVLLEAQFYGRYGVNLLPKWEYDYPSGQTVIHVSDWQPVHGDKILFTFGGDPAISVSSAMYQGKVVSTDRGAAHLLTENEKEWFLWHEFEREDADFWDSNSALMVHGVGFRHRLYYFWWLRNNLTQILFDFLQKVGTGITIFFFEQGNQESYDAVLEAAQNQVGNNAYLFPRAKDGTSAYAGPGIERIEISMTGAEMFRTIFEMLNDYMTDAILGEIGTTQEMNAGLGSGVADQHGMTADDRVKYDAVDLERPMQRLVNALYRWNDPGIPPGRFQHLCDKRNPGEFMEALGVALDAGLDVSESQVRDVLGLPAPKPGEGILSKLQSMQASAMDQQQLIPEGTPIAGNSGPNPTPGGSIVQIPSQKMKRFYRRRRGNGK